MEVDQGVDTGLGLVGFGFDLGVGVGFGHEFEVGVGVGTVAKQVAQSTYVGKGAISVFDTDDVVCGFETK